MPVDNGVYDRMADSWWDEAGFCTCSPPNAAVRLHAAGDHGRAGADAGGPIRPGRRLRRGTPGRGVRSLGCSVVGVIDSEASLAPRGRMPPAGARDRLPCHGKRSFADAPTSCMLRRAGTRGRLGRTRRRCAKPGSTTCTTPSTGAQSRLIMIMLLQEWPWTAMMPPGLQRLAHVHSPERATPSAGTARPRAGLPHRAKPRMPTRCDSSARFVGSSETAAHLQAAVREMDVGESSDTCRLVHRVRPKAGLHRRGVTDSVRGEKRDGRN